MRALELVLGIAAFIGFLFWLAGTTMNRHMEEQARQNRMVYWSRQVVDPDSRGEYNGEVAAGREPLNERKSE